MKTVDTHVHAWGPNTETFPWRAAILPPGWEGPYTHASLIKDMNRVGVDEAVVVTTPLYGRGPDANDYTLAAIDAHPDRLWGVGLLELFPENPADAAASLRRVVSHDRMLGVRIHAALAYAETPTKLDREGDWFLDNRLDSVFNAAAEEDAAVFVFPKAQQLELVERLVAAHPNVQFVVDHLSWPDETTAPDAPPWTDFEAVAEHTNVAVKVSSLPRSSTASWPYRDLHGYIRRVLDWFGPERLLLGSDYPWMDDWADYKSCLSWVEEVPFLSARDRSFLRHRTFEQIHDR
jgi:L-fuconolactonase